MRFDCADRGDPSAGGMVLPYMFGDEAAALVERITHEYRALAGQVER